MIAEDSSTDARVHLNTENKDAYDADVEAAEKAHFTTTSSDLQSSNDKDEEDQEHYEYAPLVSNKEREAFPRSSEDSPSHVLFDEFNARTKKYGSTNNTTRNNNNNNAKRYSPKMIAKAAFWLAFRSFLIVSCLVAIVFTVIAIGAYSAGRESTRQP